MNETQKMKKLDRPVIFDDFLDTSSEYFEKMMQIINKPYSTTKIKGYNLHHTIPRAISKYFGEKPQDDKMVLLSISEHFLVHFYMDKCRKDGFGHYLSPSWRLILSNNKSLIMNFVSNNNELGAIIISEILDSKGYNFSKKDKENFTSKEYTEEHWYKRAEKSMNTQISKFFEKNIPEHLQIRFIDLLIDLDVPFSISEVRKIWNCLSYLYEHPEEMGKLFYCVIHHDDYTRFRRSQGVKNSYTPELRQKRSESNKKRNISEETRRKISEGRKGKKMSNEFRKKCSERTKGRKWFNDGNKSIMAYECPEGFVPGRLGRS